ncbi:hypothetical protein AA098_14465 [Pseudomonas sp. JY-Q]|nr:hypothetical protein AA098_14465 [Pseudomonas sp. JY-Q]
MKPKSDTSMRMNSYITAQGQENLAQIGQLYLQNLRTRVELKAPHIRKQSGTGHNLLRALHQKRQ